MSIHESFQYISTNFQQYIVISPPIINIHPVNTSQLWPFTYGIHSSRGIISSEMGASKFPPHQKSQAQKDDIVNEVVNPEGFP